jgi:hypothetical protein
VAHLPPEGFIDFRSGLSPCTHQLLALAFNFEKLWQPSDHSLPKYDRVCVRRFSPQNFEDTHTGAGTRVVIEKPALSELHRLAPWQWTASWFRIVRRDSD